MKTMKTVCIYAYGGPEVLAYEDAPRPHPVFGEVLVQVHAAGPGLLQQPGRHVHAVGLDGALAKLLQQSYGSYLLGIVAAGLVAFALYSLSDARYRRI